MDALLRKFDYKYMPYENDLLIREIHSLFPGHELTADGDLFVLRGITESEIPSLRRLTYISSFQYLNREILTDQSMLENSPGFSSKRQNTRYATHGIHEYKGKYNPQIVRAMINFLGLLPGNSVLDPFCGSGTTLVESALSGINSVGADINPLAVAISNLKMSALTLDCRDSDLHLDRLYNSLTSSSRHEHKGIRSPRLDYLLHWVPEETLDTLETIRIYSQSISPTTGELFLLSASSLIREYSFQEPMDLRIRRRTTPMPEKPFTEAWKELVKQQIACIESYQKIARFPPSPGQAIQLDIRNASGITDRFDAAITSPPYATALPYIDTQRISLVWLGLCDPKEIMALESSLIGSRELFRIDKEKLSSEMLQNQANLPAEIHQLILALHDKLTVDDGFRKRAVPILLYRYFSDMKQMFNSVRTLLKERAKYALVVGKNKTTIGGNTTIIHTPELLSCLAMNCGWALEELIPLQTYQRYGLNQKNAINHETLIILKKDAD